MKGASALLSLDRFFLPRSISQVAPSNPDETVSACSEPFRSSVIITDTLLDMTLIARARQAIVHAAPCETDHAATSRPASGETAIRSPGQPSIRYGWPRPDHSTHTHAVMVVRLATKRGRGSAGQGHRIRSGRQSRHAETPSVPRITGWSAC